MLQKIIHIVGHQNAGKTTLIEELVVEFTRRDLKVGVIKHSSHSHELDTPGKDSYRHRKAGANPTAIICPNLMAVYRPLDPKEDPFEMLLPFYKDCNLILVEGNIDRLGIKMEVWRNAVGKPPLALTHCDIEFVITDDEIKNSLALLSRTNLTAVADKLTQL